MTPRPRDGSAIRVLVAHDHAGLREALAETLARQPDLLVVGVRTGLRGDAGVIDTDGEAVDVLLFGIPGFANSAAQVARCRTACRGAKIVGLYTTSLGRRELLAGGATAAINPADGLTVLLAAIRTAAKCLPSTVRR